MVYDPAARLELDHARLHPFFKDLQRPVKVLSERPKTGLFIFSFVNR
jgi:hypothetical protein